MNSTQTTNTTQPINTQLSAVLAQIEKFGFKFFGYGENNDPLVIAPNGQIIPLKIAYEFVQQQIKKANEQSVGGNGPESMPVMPQMPDSSPIDISFEKSAKKSIEKKAESQSNVQNQNAHSTPQTTQISTQQSVQIKLPIPFDDGFKIKSFDPTDLQQAEDYVKKNEDGSSTSSKTWLAELFKKFIAEYNSKNSKK